MSIGGRHFGVPRSSQPGQPPQSGNLENDRGFYDRGRGRSHRRHTRRERSHSTSSSSSSSSSGSSDSGCSSVGSLPEYEELKDRQLPSVRQSLIEWLNHPDQPITRDTVQQMRRSIKANKNDSNQQLNDDMKTIRKEVRELMKKFKDSKKEQKRHRKEAKRQRRALRREVKRERKNSRREIRRAKREGKRREPSRGGIFPGIWSPFSAPASGTEGPSSPMVPPFMPPMPGSFPFDAPRRGSLGRGASFGRGAPLGGGAPFGGPFGRGGPFGVRGPFGRGGPFGGNSRGPPGFNAIHGGWPFMQGSPSDFDQNNSGPSEFPAPVTRGAENLHEQALQMEEIATRNETAAMELRTAATTKGIRGKGMLKRLDEATKLEEEAEGCRLEASKLRAEALQLDRELAGGLEEQQRDEHGQVSGIIQS